MGNIKFEGNPPYALPIAQNVRARDAINARCCASVIIGNVISVGEEAAEVTMLARLI
jgi:hypothetical protein